MGNGGPYLVSLMGQWVAEVGRNLSNTIKDKFCTKILGNLSNNKAWCSPMVLYPEMRFSSKILGIFSKTCQSNVSNVCYYERGQWLLLHVRHYQTNGKKILGNRHYHYQTDNWKIFEAFLKLTMLWCKL